MKLISAILLLVSSALYAQEGLSAQDFRAQCKVLAEESKSNGVRGKDGWYFLKSELRHLGVGRFWGDAAQAASTARKPDTRDPLKAILAYKKLLDEQGIELILAPVPPKAIVYTDMLLDTNLPMDGERRLDDVHQEFYALLSEAGVDVIDLVPELMQARLSDDEPLYCLGDSHFSGRGAQIIGQKLAEEIKRRSWYAELEKTAFSTEIQEVEMRGDLYVAAAVEESEKRNVRYIMGGGLEDKNSPVLLFGDSHNLIFNVGGDMFAANAGLASQLAFELGMPIGVIGVRGSGATPSRIDIYRQSKKSPDFLAQKKVFIWCFSAREFTETSGWSSKIPVAAKN